MGLLSRVKTWAAGETLTAADLNAEFNNILNNLSPDYVDDASADATAMQATADPYPGGSPSLATTLREEIQRIRYQLKAILGETHWYIDPDTTIASLYTEVTTNATTSAAGPVELATDAETQALTDTERAVTPSNLGALAASETQQGIIEIATDAEAQALTATDKALVCSNLTALAASTSQQGISELATAAELAALSDSERTVTPAALAALLGYGTTFIPAHAMAARVTNGAAAGTSETGTHDIGYYYYGFDGATAEGVFFLFRMPEYWDGSNLKCKIFWTSASGASASDQVSWKVYMQSYGNNENYDQSYPTSNTLDDVVLTDAYNHIAVNTTDMVIDRYTAGEIVQCLITRNVAGNDNMTEDAKLLGIEFQFGISTQVSEWS